MRISLNVQRNLNNEDPSCDDVDERTTAKEDPLTDKQDVKLVSKNVVLDFSEKRERKEPIEVAEIQRPETANLGSVTARQPQSMHLTNGS